MRTTAKVLLTLVCGAGILFGTMAFGMAIVMVLVGSYGAALTALVAGAAAIGLGTVFGPRW